MDPTAEKDWKRLGACIKARREQLRLTQQEMYANGGPSVATIRSLENGEQEGYRNKTYGHVEDSLRWPPGTVDAILAGGDPPPSDGDAERGPPEKVAHVPPLLVTPTDSQLLMEVREILALWKTDRETLILGQQELIKEVRQLEHDRDDLRVRVLALERLLSKERQADSA